MNKVYGYVQENIIKQLEAAIKNGTGAPWQKPWIGFGRPRNYVTQRSYRGINLLLLPKNGEYLSMKQIKDLQAKYKNVHLKKGSKSNMVVLWKFPNSKKDTDDIADILIEDSTKEYKAPLFKYFNVYHISDVEGLEPHDNIIQNNNIITNNKVDSFISKYSQEVCLNAKLGTDRAYYSALFDSINLPDIKQFKYQEQFYSTLFHEMIHSTGNEKRLNRFNKNSDQFIFASESYSKEELVAEIGATMLMSQFNINTEISNQNSIAYLQGWLNKISSNVGFITVAAQQAEKSINFINEVCKYTTSISA